MLYAAFVMILVGILCFLYVSLGPTAKPTGQRKPSADRNAPPQGYSANYRYQPASSVSPQLDERIRREREIAQSKGGWQEPAYSPKQFEETPTIVEKATILKETDAGLKEILPPEPEKIHIFKMEGTLFLDHSGRIPFGSKNLSSSDPSEDDLRNFKRIGPAKLREEDGKFVFYSGNASYTYQAYELDQVVFYDQAVVLLLKDSKSPRPVYFTKEMEELKDFLSQATEV